MIDMSQSDYAYLSEEDTGVCLKCGAIVDGVKSDARRYECPECGSPSVYGLEEACLMEQINFTDEE